jgi:hypothetical protein
LREFVFVVLLLSLLLSGNGTPLALKLLERGVVRNGCSDDEREDKK